MADLCNWDSYPEPPIEADVSLGGFERIDMPIDWLSEEWALGLSSAGLGAVFRLYAVSLRQSPAGSLPCTVADIEQLVPRSVASEELKEALSLWHSCSDGRRYWSRIVPLIEDAWGRKKGKKTKDAMRKRRERLAVKLMECGMTENGAKFHEVQDMVLAALPDGAQLTTKNVMNAATAAGLVGNVRPVRTDTLGQSSDGPKVSGGQSLDSPRTANGQHSDSPNVSAGIRPTRYSESHGR
ncbi:hypothetical protein [Pseudophaeobacter flagellatus]|uniref:hypothetical protein n=1 Tax=Pseudophaeobacter flagellatus TaxID=2899119 RepID=UPI001E30206A|nr:hypothetical protein [Pseudophaeobacter flagellatus]MCD9148505.1 hypothetical protein [Pseudophaeobacter flagellatus]